MAGKRKAEEVDSEVANHKRTKRSSNGKNLEEELSSDEVSDEGSDTDSDEESNRPQINDAQQFGILTEYNKANEQLKKQFKELSGESGPELVQKSLDTVETIFRGSKWTKDTTIIATDSETFNQISNQARVVAQSIGSGNISQGLQLKDFISGWKSTFSSSAEEGYNWLNAGLLYESISLHTHGVDFLNGPLGIERKKRTLRPRLVDDTKNKTNSVTANKKRADEIVNSGLKDDTSQAAMRLYKMLMNYGARVPVYRFFNPTSFSKSVEMIFTVSFLINNGRLILNVDENGFPYVEINNGENIKSMPRYATESEGKSHIIFTLDFDTWTELISEYEIKEPLFVL